MNSSIKLATSFSPEYTMGIGIKDPLALLQLIINDLGIKDIRLGLRWDRIQDEKGLLNLSFYTKYIDEVLNSGSRLVLNVGPMKVFRWPEEHLPETIRNIVVEQNINTIRHNSEPAKRAYEYFATLLGMLKAQYGESLNNITFQIENECYNPFGKLNLKMSDEYLLELAKVLKTQFQNSSFLINSAGRLDLRKSVKFFEKLITQGIYKPEMLTLGFNYYFRLPHLYPLIKKINPLFVAFPWNMTISQLHKKQDKLGFQLEISEAQFEAWQSQKTPGSSYEDLQHLLNTAVNFFPESEPEKIIRLWGIERFAKRIVNTTLSDEQLQIYKAIREF